MPDLDRRWRRRIGGVHSFAIEHVASGRRDGNYFDDEMVAEMLSGWKQQFPRDQFVVIKVPMKQREGGATNGHIPLRMFDAHEWSVAR